MKQVPKGTVHKTGEALEWCHECQVYEDPCIRFPNLKKGSREWLAIREEMKNK